MEMNATSDAAFYLEVIEGDHAKLLSMFLNEPLELRESLIINYAFDMLEEIGDTSVCEKLAIYIDDEVDIYCYKKSGAITLLGALGNKNHEMLVEKYLSSNDYLLFYSALCSMCQLLVRNELSLDATDRTIIMLVDILTSFDSSIDVAVECALALNKVGYEKLDDLLILAKSKSSTSTFSAFYRDYISYLSIKDFY